MIIKLNYLSTYKTKSMKIKKVKYCEFKIIKFLIVIVSDAVNIY